jgi:type II secretory pathway pseudopilin PulG
MLALNYLVFGIILLLVAGAIITFSYAVIKNRRTRRAIVYARRILAGGQADSEDQFRDVYRQLATASNDLEAAKLWKKLDELKDLAGTHIAR